jgi:hypothetical protein
VDETPAGSTGPNDGPAVGLTASYGKRLRELRMDDTPEGMLVLQLAYLLEFSDESLSAKAAISRSLMAAWRDVNAQPPAKGDEVDEVLEARRRKFGGGT